jgi:hypothetical protein
VEEGPLHDRQGRRGVRRHITGVARVRPVRADDGPLRRRAGARVDAGRRLLPLRRAGAGAVRRTRRSRRFRLGDTVRVQVVRVDHGAPPGGIGIDRHARGRAPRRTARGAAPQSGRRRCDVPREARGPGSVRRDGRRERNGRSKKGAADAHGGRRHGRTHRPRQERARDGAHRHRPRPPGRRRRAASPSSSASRTRRWPTT